MKDLEAAEQMSRAIHTHLIGCRILSPIVEIKPQKLHPIFVNLNTPGLATSSCQKLVEPTSLKLRKVYSLSYVTQLYYVYYYIIYYFVISF